MNTLQHLWTRRLSSLLSPLWASLIVWSALPGSSEAAYSYPIGIPKAWIDPEVERPPRPTPWSSEVAGYYCVDNINGTDTGRPYGSPGAPRKTIPSSLGPGTYCEVSGVYNTYAGGWSILK